MITTIAQLRTELARWHPDLHVCIELPSRPRGSYACNLELKPRAFMTPKGKDVVAIIIQAKGGNP